MGKELDGAAAFTGLVDLAAAALGGHAVWVSDDFFAAVHNLLEEGRGVFDPDAYYERGKVMDGWESRRKRVPGHDSAIVALGVPGEIHGVDIDTNHFLGNHPPYASVDACWAPGASAEHLRDKVEWQEILACSPLQRGSQNLFATERGRFTHVRLNIYPDGGVARLRVYGEPTPQDDDGVVDLACANQGGRAVAASDVFFSPMRNLTLPARSTYMGGGWETRRRRDAANDWIIVRLGRPGRLQRLVLDTAHFKGNYPDRAAVDGLYWPDAAAYDLEHTALWEPLLPESKLRADTEHSFDVQAGPFTHLRLRIFPCGGVARLRAFGVAADADPDPLCLHLNELDDTAATEALTRCCGSSRWVAAMLRLRPFGSRAHLFGEAERQWWRLGDGDWLEAFGHHPRIGADIDALREKFASTASWSSGEQAAVAGASEATLEALRDGNVAYEERFGFLYIVCATGKSAEQMLGLLEARLPNRPEDELRIAAGEQAKITAIRLEKLLP